MVETRAIHITGIVQGVGFRPFVYNLAHEYGLDGWVNNASDGVHIKIRGEADVADAFIAALPDRAPAMSRIETIDVDTVDDEPALSQEGFVIRKSDAGTANTTLVSPDIATCPECVDELFDPSNRRYHYPFINCTQCGPRFTIIESLPYDRPATSMKAFKMCPPCDEEYHDPSNRRFHAQPDACFDCGPHLFWLQDGTRTTSHDLASSDALIERAVKLLEEGGVLAIKGLGGYHLSCDATNEEAVQRLRTRKHRPDKPFALMVPALEDARNICEVTDVEADLLTGTVRPIVLLRMRPDAVGSGPGKLAGGVAAGLQEMGIMLPYTPLQHLLLRAIDRPLVMTSGNITEEPILADDDEASRLLAPIADALLGNDRIIRSRYDDSVTRVVDERFCMVRRARGYAPYPLKLPDKLCGLPSLMACGPEQKSTFCLTREDKAFVSQHLGDLENALSWNAWVDTVALYERLFGIEPTSLACDMHPGYLATKWAEEQAEKSGLPLTHIQHHHAHIAAVAAENDVSDPVIGVALDGTGYGIDKTIWGGEILICDWTSVTRVGHLRTIPMPGSAQAVWNPCRMALGALLECGLVEHPGAAGMLGAMEEKEVAFATRMVEKGINCPLTSSAGRLFDSVSALLGITVRASYEGQAAIELEGAIRDGGAAKAGTEPQPADVARATGPADATGKTGPADPAGAFAHLGLPDALIDSAPLLETVLDRIVAGWNPSDISAGFHDQFCRAIVQRVLEVSEQTGIRTAALGGGVFMNRHVLSQLVHELEGRGMRVLLPHDLPANDGSISYGQAVIALARMRAEKG